SLPLENVQIVSPFVGGAFGSKGFQWSHILLCAAAARETRRPVKLTFTRPQMFDSAGQRARTIQRFSVGADQSGKLIALRHATLTHCSPVMSEARKNSAGQNEIERPEQCATKMAIKSAGEWQPRFIRQCSRPQPHMPPGAMTDLSRSAALHMRSAPALTRQCHRSPPA